MEQKYVDGSAFAMMFLRDENADAAVVKMLFWTPDISFNIYLGLIYQPGDKKVLLLSRESIVELRRPEPITSSPPWPDFQKKKSS